VRLVLRNDSRDAGILNLPPTGVSYVRSSTFVAALNVSRDTVYAHVERLGGRRIGNGPRGRLRFDLDRALKAWTTSCVGRQGVTGGETARACGESAANCLLTSARAEA
jgi:hypothetical protein